MAPDAMSRSASIAWASELPRCALFSSNALLSASHRGSAVPQFEHLSCARCDDVHASQ